MLRWNRFERPLILASMSPRRKQILENMGLAFDIVAPEVENEESYITIDTIEESVQRLAHAKAHSIAARFPSSLILGSDTIVVIDSLVLGKPRHRKDALDMLEQLSGRQHQVLSAVTVTNARETRSMLSETVVKGTGISIKEPSELPILTKPAFGSVTRSPL